MTIEAEGKRAQRFAYLDGLRLICAAGVVLFHYCVVAPFTQVLPATYMVAPDILVYGQFGVEVFFVISGFVISWSTIGRTSPAFLWARFLRLYPAYWVCVSVTALTLLAIRPDIPTLVTPSVGGYIVNLSMLQSFVGVRHVDPAYWSLAVELKFYAIVATLIAIGLRPTSFKLAAVWLGICLVAPFLPRIIGTITLTQFAPFFISGMLVQQLVATRKRWFGIGLLIVSMALQAQQMLLAHVQHVERGFAPYNPHIAVGVVWFGTLLVVACAFMPNPARLVAFLGKCGAITYPLYLIHCVLGMLLLTFIAPVLPPRIALIVAIGAMFLLAGVIAFWVEPRMRGWLKTRGAMAARRAEAGGVYGPAATRVRSYGARLSQVMTRRRL